MAKKEKERAVKEWIDRLNRATGVYLTDFRGLTVEAMTDLRKMCRDEQVEYKVVKNSLLKHALQEIGDDSLFPYLVGPTGVALVYDDPIKPAKLLKSFSKEKAPLKVKVAYGEGRLFLPQEVERLASIPSREVLVTEAIRRMKGPIQGLHSLLHGLLWRLVCSLDQIARSKEDTKEE